MPIHVLLTGSRAVSVISNVSGFRGGLGAAVLRSGGATHAYAHIKVEDAQLPMPPEGKIISRDMHISTWSPHAHAHCRWICWRDVHAAARQARVQNDHKCTSISSRTLLLAPCTPVAMRTLHHTASHLILSLMQLLPSLCLHLREVTSGRRCRRR